MATPEHHRAGLAQIPTPPGCSAGAAAGGDAALAARALAAEGRLRRLLRINKRLNSEQRLPRLLELIVDTVIELTDAERGFLLLDDDGGGSCRSRSRATSISRRWGPPSSSCRARSREQAARGRRADRHHRRRRRRALSRGAVGLRSRTCARCWRSRWSVKGQRRGDASTSTTACARGRSTRTTCGSCSTSPSRRPSRSRTRASLAELRRRERQVEALNRRLEAELAARREELSGMKQELRDNREALAVRYDYRNIVGRTPRMLELFRLLDRITDTALPVVIQGESGTGKELVARAIHINGPRRERPFVGENCAAIPETLLESTLFGYVRGAFTGADRDTRGPVRDRRRRDAVPRRGRRDVARRCRGSCCACCRRASSAASAASGRARSTCASSPPRTAISARMVEEGRFRQDLFFRLNVARDRAAAAARAARGHPADGRALPGQAAAGDGAARRRSRSSRRRWRACAPIAGPATCASSRTS